MRCALFFVLLLANSFSAAAATGSRVRSGEFELKPGEKVIIALHDEEDKDNYIDISMGGKFLQTESFLGDRFVSFNVGGKNVFYHAQDLDGDGTKELFVRLVFFPMGVMRVLKWNAKAGKFEKMKFGSKQEDGLPLPLKGNTTLLPDGNIRFKSVDKSSGARTSHLIKWNGKDYSLPPVKE